MHVSPAGAALTADKELSNEQMPRDPNRSISDRKAFYSHIHCIHIAGVEKWWDVE